MSDPGHQYVIQALASGGFAILDAQAAFTLRPDLWRSQGEAESSLRNNGRIRGLAASVHWMRAEINGRSVRIACRSTTRLAERVEEITGMRVGTLTASVSPWEMTEEERQDLLARRRKAEAEERRAWEVRDLRAVAEERLGYGPRHSDAEILAARQRMDELGAAYRTEGERG